MALAVWLSLCQTLCQSITVASCTSAVHRPVSAPVLTVFRCHLVLSARQVYHPYYIRNETGQKLWYWQDNRRIHELRAEADEPIEFDSVPFFRLKAPVITDIFFHFPFNNLSF
jgi:hypothetical protein